MFILMVYMAMICLISKCSFGLNISCLIVAIAMLAHPWVGNSPAVTLFPWPDSQCDLSWYCVDLGHAVLVQWSVRPVLCKSGKRACVLQLAFFAHFT